MIRWQSGFPETMLPTRKTLLGTVLTSRTKIGWGLAILWLGLATAAPVFAQYPVNQSGRLFDANPQVGGNRINAARPLSPLAGGNPYATGNVRFGQSLRSASPISDPTAFRGTLGSSYLSSFRRDSVSAADVGVGTSIDIPFARPYYDPSGTAGTSGFLRGQYGPAGARPGTATGQVPINIGAPGTGVTNTLDARLDFRTNDAGGLRSQITGLAPGGSAGQLSSTIFGVNPLRPSALTGDNNPPAAAPLRAPRPAETSRPPQAGYETPTAPAAPRPLGSRELERTPLDLVLRKEAAPLLERTANTPFSEIVRKTEGPAKPAGARGNGGLTAPPAEGGVPPPAEPRKLETSVLPGFDLFTDMQLALSLARSPSAGWFEDMQTAVRNNPALAQKYQKAAAQNSEQFLSQMMNTPIRSFVGQGESAVNNELTKAEAQLEIGQFYDAANRFDAAHRLDPSNPLPLIGKGHALLAAGDYLSAATHLLRGLERFPELTRFALDLQTLVGGGEVVDIRRADLLSRLQQREDPQLRFLLGYLEYYTGHQESGLENLRQAARGASPTSIIARYPDMLSRDGVLPPPKLQTPNAVKPAPAEREKSSLEPPQRGARPLDAPRPKKQPAPSMLKVPPATQPRAPEELVPPPKKPDEELTDLLLPPPQPVMEKDPR